MDVDDIVCEVGDGQTPEVGVAATVLFDDQQALRLDGVLGRGDGHLSLPVQDGDHVDIELILEAKLLKAQADVEEVCDRAVTVLPRGHNGTTLDCQSVELAHLAVGQFDDVCRQVAADVGQLDVSEHVVRQVIVGEAYDILDFSDVFTCRCRKGEP